MLGEVFWVARMKALFTFFIAMTVAGTAWSVDTDPLWERYIEAKISFQSELAQLFLDSNPEYKELILVSRDLQVTLARMRRLEYYYLLEHDSGRIVRDRGTARWSNFQWSEEDRTNRMKESPVYATLIAEKIVLEEKNRDNPDWPAARQAFAELMTTAQYRAIVKRLTDTVAGIEEELKSGP
jgi:hypothetical protein